MICRVQPIIQRHFEKFWIKKFIEVVAIKKFRVGKFLEFKMVDSMILTDQVQEFQLAL
jgi:hypothetical protein